MEEIILGLVQRMTAVETKLNIIMFINGIFATGVVGMIVSKIFKNGKPK